MDSYFENTPKEHFEEIWNDVKKYEAYGLDVKEFLGHEEPEMRDNADINNYCKHNSSSQIYSMV